MSVVRYYDRTFDLAIFVGKGWRGFLVRILARIVSWLERKIEWHVMHIEMRTVGMDTKQMSSLRRMFSEESNRGQRDVAGLINTDVVEHRQRVRAKNALAPEESYRERRTMRAQDFFARYLNAGRAGVYRYGRKQKLANPDGDVAEENSNANV